MDKGESCALDTAHMAYIRLDVGEINMLYEFYSFDHKAIVFSKICLNSSVSVICGVCAWGNSTLN